jgi:CheY-like chemotaxis protein
MARSDGTRHVSIFNSRPDFIEALRGALERDGFAASSAHLADIQSGALDLLGFVQKHQPELVVYDLPRPYETHWNILRLLKDMRCLRDVVWVLTTTDKRALEAAVDASGVVEIIFGEPYGVDDVVVAVAKRFPAAAEGR